MEGVKMFTPGIPLFAVFGDPDNPRKWVRKRVVCIDDEGEVMVVGESTFKDSSNKLHHGSKRLKYASEYSDFIHIDDEPTEEEMPSAVLQAMPGWRCVMGANWIADIAAWDVREGNRMVPIVLDGGELLPIDAWGPVDPPVVVMQPSDRPPIDAAALDQVSGELAASCLVHALWALRRR